MTYALYKILHFTGIFLLMTSLSGLAVYTLNGGTRQNNRARVLLATFHGLGLILVLVGGFGLLVKIGLGHNPAGWPGWVHAKVLIWLILGAMLTLARKSEGAARMTFIALPLLGLLAAILAGYKPF